MDEAVAPRRQSARGALAVLIIMALAIGAFSLFVGWNKAFASYDILRQHTAWTIHIPVWAGRTIGVVEMLAAATLLLSLPVRPLTMAGAFGALAIAIGNLVGGVVHVLHDETQTYTQSAVVIPLCFVLAALAFARARRLRAASPYT